MKRGEREKKKGKEENKIIPNITICNQNWNTENWLKLIIIWIENCAVNSHCDLHT